MNDEPGLTLDILEKKRQDALHWTEKAIQRNPDAYCTLKKMVHRILTRPVDVSEYYPAASRLSGLIQSLSQIGGETIFHYFYPHIEPGKNGDPRYFRAMCLDLSEQIQALDRWRVSHRNIRLIRQQGES